MQKKIEELMQLLVKPVHSLFIVKKLQLHVGHAAWKPKDADALKGSEY